MYNYVKERPNIDDYYPLYLETGWNTIQVLEKSEIVQALKNSFLCVCVYDGNNLIGFGRILSDGVVYACLYDVIVKPDYQHKGIGSAIVKMLVSHCKSINMRSIHLFTAKGLKEFYVQLGFEVRPDEAPGMKYVGKPDE